MENKYNFEIDLRNNPGAFHVKNANGYYEIIIDDYPAKTKIKVPYDRYDKETDNAYKECGEMTYTELEEENIRLRNALEDRDNLIGQYEEHQDALREKYYSSDRF